MRSLKVPVEKQEVLQVLIMDLLFFSSIIPSSLLFCKGFHDSPYEYRGEFARHAIQPATPELLLNILRAFSYNLDSTNHWDTLKQSPVLSTLDMQKYASLSIERRILEISNCNFSERVCRRFQSDSLCNRMNESKRLHHWLLACSDTDEQYWINTCEGAAKNQVKIWHSGTIAHLLVLSDIILDDLVKKRLPQLSETEPWVQSFRIWKWSLPSEKTYATRLIKEFEKAKKQISEKSEFSQFLVYLSLSNNPRSSKSS